MHASLFEVTTRENMIRAMAVTSQYIETIYFPFSIRTRLEKSFPESPVRIFCYPSLAHPKYFFMFKNNVHIKPTIAMAQLPGTTIDREEIKELVRELRLRVFGAKRQPHLVIAKELLIKMYGVVMREEMTELSPSDLSLSLYYMTDKQKSKAMRKPMPQLPEGYYYDEIYPDEEGEIVNNTWQHAGPGDLEQTMAKLAQLPSSCVRYDGQPVAFEMIDPAGFFNNQYVFEEHRRKGLGNAVEIDLIKKAITTGISPFKTVAKDNRIVLTASNQNDLWTTWVDDENKPQTIVFQTWAH